MAKTQSAPHSAPRPAGLRFMDWTNLHQSLVWAYDGPVLAASHHAVVTDSATSCWLIRRGSVRLETGGRKVAAKAGDWVFVASPTRRQDFSADIHILSLHFHLHWPGGEALVDRSRNGICRAERIPQLERAARPLIRLLNRHFPGVQSYLPMEQCSRGVYLRIQALLPPIFNAYLDAQEFLGNGPRLRNGGDERISQIMAALGRVPLDESFRSETLAGRLGLSRSHLDALFMARMGMTPRRHWEQRRLEAARRMLRHTGKSVKAIAFELGFRHESHFCLWFKRLHGKRPGELR